MKIIKELTECMKKELCEANRCIDQALLRKIDYPDISATYYDMSKQHVENYNKLHNHVVTKIQAARSSNITVPKGMLDIWDYMHKELIDEATELKSKIASY